MDAGQEHRENALHRCRRFTRICGPFGFAQGRLFDFAENFTS